MSWKSGDPIKVVNRVERTKEMVFSSLHHHTTYSYLDGFGTPESHIERAAELGMTKMAVTEHGNISSHVRLEQAANAQGIGAIFGCELYCGGVGEEAQTRRKNHLTVLARSQEGYRNLLRVVSRGWSEGFYHEPTVSGEMLAEHSEGLVVLSGCTGSLLATSLIGGKNIAPEDASYERAKRVAMRFQRSLGDAYFLEVQAFPELEKSKTVNQALARMSEELGIPLVATLDAHYTKPSEGELQAILHNVRPGKSQSLEEQMRNWGYDVPLCPLTDKEIYLRLVGTGLTKVQAEQAIRMSRTIADSCNVVLPKIDSLRYPLPEGMSDPVVLFRQWVNEGWNFRGFPALPPAERERYITQVKYEMALIEDKGFVDYFLVVADVVKAAKDDGIPVGPARGSAAASLVCYLMRITEVNPMLFPTLLFERFIDANRHDLPDIDLDFDDELRWKVRDRLVNKYGADRVGNIGTFVKYKGKNSLDDVQRVFNIPQWEVDKVKELLIERSSGDLRAAATVEDTIEMFPQVKEVFDKYPDLYKATLLEGNVRGMSVHAAGLVIANDPLTNACAIYCKIDKKTGLPVIDSDTGLPAEVISLDKYDAEYLNVLKLDVLGLKTMGMIRIALEEIGMTLEELYRIPLDDEDSLLGFQQGDVVGVFQFDGRAMRSVNNGVVPDNFFEVADVNALARPGPLHSGATAEYIDVKHGRKEATHYHEIVDKITEHTNYQIVYQEQILQVVRLLGGFSWEEAARIRKIISKKRGEQEFQQQRNKFVEGAAANGMNADDANKVFSMLATAGAYAFCLEEKTLVYKGGRGGGPVGSRQDSNTITLGELSDLLHKRGNNNVDGCVVCGTEEKWHVVSGRRRLYYSGRCRRCKSWLDQFRLRGLQIYSMDDDGIVRPRRLKNVSPRAMKFLVCVRTETGKEIIGSPEHPVLTERGYIKIENLTLEDKLVCVGEKPTPRHLAPHGAKSKYSSQVLSRSGGICEWCSKEDNGSSHCLEFAHVLCLADLNGDRTKYDDPNNVLLLCNSCHKKFDYGKGERKKRWTRGRETVLERVSLIEGKGIGWVCDIEMDDINHNYVGNGIVSHNNSAHCISYGSLAFWTMWLKRHHPQAFFVASLRKCKDDKEGRKRREQLLRDTLKFGRGLTIQPLHMNKSLATWSSNEEGIRPGFIQIPGIGDKTAEAILEMRDSMGVFRDWKDFQKVKGVGPSTVAKVQEFMDSEDPFGLELLSKTIAKVRAEIVAGVYDTGPYSLPHPTHTSIEVPYDRTDTNVEVIWLGVIRDRNLKDLFELHHSRTGEVLDPDNVKDPHLNEWVVMLGEDETDILTITVDRWRYKRFKEAAWNLRPDHDLVLVRGHKKAVQARRAVYVTDLFVIDPDDDEEAEDGIEQA